jgi:hypothetical protein
MKSAGRTSVSEFLGDLVIYRNLAPVDRRLPPLAEIRQQAGLPGNAIPRKSAPEYGRVMAHMLKQARSLDIPNTSIERLAYVGDTRLNDVTAFANLCRAGGWSGRAFIGAEQDVPASTEIVEQDERTLYLANRWAALADFDRFCQAGGFPFDERTAVIVDLDKTAIGARGRNDHVIDRARVEAVRRTVGDLLGQGFDAAGFEEAYKCLNQPEYHPFTADNQDYLAYVCLILGSGLYALQTLVAEVRACRMGSFEQFITAVDGRAGDLPAELRRTHETVYALVCEGDPTPFKAFRANEYLATAERMGCMDDDAPAAELLEQEITITQEVREMALAWRERGALLFGLSDKPDEASMPPGDQVATGRGNRAPIDLPIHRMETHAVGAG